MKPVPGKSDEDIATDLSCSLETEIRNLAHAKWEAAGRPILDSDEERHAFWYAAEKEILQRHTRRESD